MNEKTLLKHLTRVQGEVTALRAVSAALIACLPDRKPMQLVLANYIKEGNTILASTTSEEARDGAQAKLDVVAELKAVAENADALEGLLAVSPRTQN